VRHSRSAEAGQTGEAGPAAAAAGVVVGVSAGLQEGEGSGSHGSQSQEARSCKRRRTSCEVMSVQRLTGSMQTTEA
jgi:hypothetical protein